MRTIQYKPGDQVICNGYRGSIIRYYTENMVEVRLARGTVCVDAGDIAPLVNLCNGLAVIAKPYKGHLSAITYANRTQALIAAERLGGLVYHSGRPFYVGPRYQD